MMELLKEIVQIKWLVFLLLGVVLVGLSAISNIDLGGKGALVVGGLRWLAGAAGTVCMLIAIFFAIWPGTTEWRRRLPSVAILSPREGDKCDKHIGVNGTINRDLPAGWKLQLLRRFGTDQPYFPDTTATIQRGNDKKYNWTMTNAFVGGEPGDERIFEIWLVGPNSAIFFDEWQKASTNHWTALQAVHEAAKANGVFKALPGLKQNLSDAFKLASIRIYRR